MKNTSSYISLLTKHCFINFVLNFHNQSPSNKFGNFVRARIVTPGQHYSSLQNMIRVVFKQSSIALFSSINTVMQFESLQSEQGL